VSDYGPGHDAEEAFIRGFKESGGEVVGTVRVPLQNPDFAPYLQRVKDARPDALMVFIPAGRTATAVMKTFGDLGLDKAGVKLIGPGDITTDEELPNMGDVALGVLTVHHYSAAATRPANKAFVAAWKKEYGADSTPNFVAVGAWDGMDMMFQVIKAQKGKLDADKTMEMFKNYRNPNSPRGDLDRSRHPRHRAERVPARGAQGRRSARQRRARDRRHGAEGSVEGAEQEVRTG